MNKAFIKEVGVATPPWKKTLFPLLILFTACSADWIFICWIMGYGLISDKEQYDA